MGSPTRAFRVAILCNEHPANDDLRGVLENDPEVVVEGEFRDSPPGWQEMALRQPDIVFLELGEQGLSGLASFRSTFPFPHPYVIVIAPDESFAFRAFELRVLSYHARPVAREILQASLRSAKAIVEQSWVAPHRVVAPTPQASGNGGGKSPKRLLVKSRGALHVLKVGEIDWIEAEGAYVCLHTPQGKHLLRECMGTLEHLLPADQFIRIHRSAIVNFDRIKEMRPLSYGEFAVFLHDGTRLIMSRSHREKMFGRLAAFD